MRLSQHLFEVAKLEPLFEVVAGTHSVLNGPLTHSDQYGYIIWSSLSEVHFQIGYVLNFDAKLEPEVAVVAPSPNSSIAAKVPTRAEQ